MLRIGISGLNPRFLKSKCKPPQGLNYCTGLSPASWMSCRRIRMLCRDLHKAKMKFNTFMTWKHNSTLSINTGEIVIIIIRKLLVKDVNVILRCKYSIAFKQKNTSSVWQGRGVTTARFSSTGLPDETTLSVSTRCDAPVFLADQLLAQKKPHEKKKSLQSPSGESSWISINIPFPWQSEESWFLSRLVDCRLLKVKVNKSS